MRSYHVLAYATIFVLTVGCQSPSLLQGNVKREYFPKGQLKSEFIMSDSSGKNGILKEYGLEGKVITQTPIRNGLKNGVQKVFDNEGNIVLETTYVNGKKNGPQKSYYADGQLWYIMPYKDGLLHGHAVMYDEKGHIVREADYVNGKRID